MKIEIDGLDMDQIKELVILETLKKHKGNRSWAAHDLGLTPRTIRYFVAKWRKEGWVEDHRDYWGHGRPDADLASHNPKPIRKKKSRRSDYAVLP